VLVARNGMYYQRRVIALECVAHTQRDVTMAAAMAAQV
jgi:hypothetical protein